MELTIRKLGDVVLRKAVKPIKEVTAEHAKVLSEMARLMYSVKGLGLAAPQVGIQSAMCVIDAGTSGLYKLINPKLVEHQGLQVMEEGCLSIPGVNVKVKRAKSILVSALDETGKPVLIEAKDLLACVFQHEMDHLNGKLIIDYAPFFKRMKIKKKFTKNESLS